MPVKVTLLGVAGRQDICRAVCRVVKQRVDQSVLLGQDNDMIRGVIVEVRVEFVEEPAVFSGKNSHYQRDNKNQRHCKKDGCTPTCHSRTVKNAGEFRKLLPGSSCAKTPLLKIAV